MGKFSLMKMTLVLGLIFFYQYARAQNEVINLDTEVQGNKISVPFAGIKIIDARFDKSNIGIVTSYKHAKKIGRTIPAVFPDSLPAYLFKILHEILVFNSNRKDTLVVLFKQFRYTDHEDLVNRQNGLECLLKVSVSFYSFGERGWSKLYSVNTIFSDNFMRYYRIYGDKINIRCKAISDMLASLFYKAQWTPNKEVFSSKDVFEGLKKRFAIPAISDTIFKEGLYKTFKDFKENSPTTTAIRIIYNGKKPVSILDSSGKEIKYAEYWGLCDGKARYILFKNKFWLLEKSDNSFKFLSYLSPDDFSRIDAGDNLMRHGLILGSIDNFASTAETKEYFYINMDEGDIYLEEIFGKSSIKNIQRDIFN